MILLLAVHCPSYATRHDYGDALRKSILFFEGQRSGKLPPDQRLKWRRDSALRDGSTAGVRLIKTSHYTLSSFSNHIHELINNGV